MVFVVIEQKRINPNQRREDIVYLVRPKGQFARRLYTFINGKLYDQFESKEFAIKMRDHRNGKNKEKIIE